MFSDRDRKGILSYGESYKASDRSTIGKFGLGQKAVFHLCDAFVVHVVGVNEPFSEVVNPFLEVNVAGNVTRHWDCINNTDTDLLRERAGQDFQKHAFILWLPFRSDQLIPAPGAGFSTLQPNSEEIVEEFVRRDDMRVLLTALRHLKSIEICRQGKTLCAVRVGEAQRLSGPHVHPCTRSFHGTIYGPDASLFVGREATTREDGLDHLRGSNHWPKTISALHADPIPEKGEQHGAVTLLRTGYDGSQPSELQISWAVFLPTSKGPALPIDMDDAVRMHLLLHGYFFLDSGRRQIEGIADPVNHDDPEDEAGLRRAWNTRLRDTVVLPLIPALLKDALDQRMMVAKDLTHLTAAVAKSSWFQDNRASICKKHALVRVLRSPDVRPRVAWRLIPMVAELRSLPAILANSPELIDRLFNHIYRWAQSRSITLCIDQSASLTAKPIQWAVAELDSLFATLSPQAFQSERLAELLANLLTEVELTPHRQGILARHLVRAFRKAMIERRRLAAHADLKNVLDHVPRDRFFALPGSVQLRDIFRALALSNADILPVSGELLDVHDQSSIAEVDLAKLLTALAPIIGRNDGSLADQASAAALALLTGHDISRLATLRDFRDIEIFRARDPMAERVVVLSFAELCARSQQGFLFRSTPDVENRLRTLVGALPSVRPLITYANTDEISHLTRTANKNDFHAIISREDTFEPDASKRAQMIKLLTRLGGGDNIDALRWLCAGSPSVHALWNAGNFPTEIERIVKALLIGIRRQVYLVPSVIVDALTGNQIQELEIRTLDTPTLEQLIEDGVDVFSQLITDKSERDALLTTTLTDDLLRRLPVHEHSDGAVTNATLSFWEDDGWAVAGRLRQSVPTIVLSEDPAIRRRQQNVVPPWSPLAQIKAALSQEHAHCYWEEILQAIEAFCRDNEGIPPAVGEPLRTTAWLGAAGRAVAPEDVLRLPPSVEEAAERHFGDSADYITVRRLHEEIRTHPGFPFVDRHVIPTCWSSLDKLSEMISNSCLQGRLGLASDYPIEQFTELAGLGDDLKLPGWQLLAAVMSSFSSDPDSVRRVVECFHGIPESESEMAGEHLDALAKVVKRDAPQAEDAYYHGFRAVAQWSEVARRNVLARARVPTKSGGWRIGSEVVAEGNGVAFEYVLKDKYARILSNASQARPYVSVDDPTVGNDEGDFEQASVRQHCEFLESWRNRVPSELVAVYLGIAAAHNPSMTCYRETWIGDTTTSYIDYAIEEIRRHWKNGPALLLIEEIQGDNVKTIALSGHKFLAPMEDIASKLIVGNYHRRKKFIVVLGTHTRKRIITFQVQKLNHEALSFNERVHIFREFIEVAAAECLSDDAMDDVRRILNRATNIGQTTLEDTERLLRDQLPTLLTYLKLHPESSAYAALNRYNEKALRYPDELRGHKGDLWRSIYGPTAAEELLSAIRARITDQGYSASRVLFELFQNADDAYVQWDHGSDHSCFRVHFGEDGLRIVHWGRPINHRGYERDLLNMLVMNFSEKRPGEDVTGKFGLGFKCVHLLSDSVGIASGFIALRTVGGLLPEPWPEGLDLAEAEILRRPTRKATVIDVPYTNSRMMDRRHTEHAFLGAMTWLPPFARHIRRIEVRGREQRTVECSESPFIADQINVVAVHDSGRQTQRALRLVLGNGYSLLLKIGTEGPECFEPSVGRIWNLAPLEEDVRSGWLLNGPFPVDPGRGRLAGEIEVRQARFKCLGRSLGERLLELYDLVNNGWDTIAIQLALKPADSDAHRRFWRALFDVMIRDLDDGLARCLHAADRGYGRLVAELPVVPTRLRSPFDELVAASCINWFTDKALADAHVFHATRNWRSADQLKNHIVASDVAAQLRKLGFGHIRSITLSDLLRIEMGTLKRIDVCLATRLGQVIMRTAIEREPLDQERHEILKETSQAHFRAQDGKWRPVRLLSSKHVSDDEALRCDFAPEEALLHEEYGDDSLEFFKVARMQSGYGPSVHLLSKWVSSARDENRRRAVLRYLARGQQGPDLTRSLRDDLPNWMAEVTEQLSSHPLLNGWNDEDLKILFVRLAPERFEVPTPPPPRRTDVSNVLKKLYEWWKNAGQNERSRYKKSVYPEWFDPACLSDGDDRVAWFTMFALACYQLLGRTQDGQHRNFIEDGWREGWWTELAQSEPPDGVQPWLDRLARWSAADRFDQTYHQWERTLVDLYTIARWLKVYVELFLTFPRIVTEHNHLPPLDTILRPSDSPVVQRLGLDATPIDRSLGIGANWLIRELSRNGVYDASNAKLMAPYCWTPSWRVRSLLKEINPDLHLTADNDASPVIHNFMIEHLDAERALFDGDFDLPLQIITRKRHRNLLIGWFEDAGLETPEFEDESEDDEN